MSLHQESYYYSVTPHSPPPPPLSELHRRMSCRVEVSQGKRSQDRVRSITGSEGPLLYTGQHSQSFHYNPLMVPTLQSVMAKSFPATSSRGETSSHASMSFLLYIFHRYVIPCWMEICHSLPVCHLFLLHHPVPGRRPVPGCPSCMSFTAKYGILCTATYCT
jgi:hypothetical protein